MTFPVPVNEAARLKTLRGYDILDTPAEDAFDDIARLASAICGTPISLVSLLDESRQWFKARVGLDATETHRDLAFCSHAIMQPDVLVIPNALEDARFVGNPLVTADPHIRFYAGAPLRTASGHALGTLCVIDRIPRELTALQKDALQVLSRQIVAQLELRQKISEQARLMAAQLHSELELRHSHARFEAFINTSPLVAFLKDAGGRYLYVNKPFERHFNVELEDIWGTTDADWFPDEIAEQVRRNDELVRAWDEPLETTETVPTADGQARVWTVYKFPLADASGQPCVGGVAVDITQRVIAEQELLRSQARYAEAQRIARVGSWEFDIATGQIIWSAETFRLLDFDPMQPAPTYEELTRRYHPDDVPMHNALIQKCVEDGTPYDFELRGIMNDGSLRWFHAIGQAERNAEGKPIRLFGTIRDRTDAKLQQEQLESANAKLACANAKLEAANAQLKALATTDGLTGLKNHRSFQEKLAEEFERSRRYHKPLALLLLDVDKFKQFNDTFGHPAGDETLKQVAATLQAEARATDFVARYGGEEFVIALPETDTEGAMILAERIREAIAEHEWKHRAITVSVGVASLQISTLDPAFMIEEADKALYLSKQNGRNQVTLAASGGRGNVTTVASPCGRL